MPTATVLSLGALCAALLLIPTGCGFGTAGLAAASGGGGGGANGQSVASELFVPRRPTSPAPIFFVLTDQEGDRANASIEWRTATTSFRPITLAASSRPLTDLPSGSATIRVDWDFATDLGGEGYVDGIEIRLTIAGGISPPIATGIGQGNDPPVIEFAGPFPPGLPEYGGNTDVALRVRDTAADMVRVVIEFNNDATGGFPETGWHPARPAGTPASSPTPAFAIEGVAAGPGGMVTTFRWDTAVDLDGFGGNVKLRLTPEDQFGPGGV